MLKIESLKKWYKGELWETVKSILIIISIFAILVIAGGIANSLAGNYSNFALSGNQETASSQIHSSLSGLYYSTCNNYILPQNHSAQDTFGYVYGMALGVDFLKSMKLSLYIPIPIPIPIPGLFMGFMFGSESNIYVSSIIDTKSKSTSFLADFTNVMAVPLMILFAIQAKFFYTIVMLGLIFFLPFGIILRAIPFLRPIGGTLIAIGIGISLIYPALLIGFNLPITGFTNSIFQISQHVPNSYSSVFPGILGVFSGLVNLVGYGGVVLQGVDAGILAINSVYSPLNLITYTMINTLVQFLLLIFDLVIGIVIIDHIAKLLGGRLPTGIGKFKIA